MSRCAIVFVWCCAFLIAPISVWANPPPKESFTDELEKLLEPAAPGKLRSGDLKIRLSGTQAKRLDVDYIGVFFGGNWCPQARNFETRLKAFYRKAKAEGKSVEIVYVSMEFSLEQWTGHTRNMQWPLVRFDVEHHGHEHKFFDQLGKRALPGFAVVRRNGELLSTTYAGEWWLGPDVVLKDLKLLLDGKPVAKKVLSNGIFKTPSVP